MTDQNPFSPPKSSVEIKDENSDWPLGAPRRTPISHGWTWIADAFRLFAKSPALWIANTIIYMAINIVSAFIPGVSIVLSIVYPAFVAGFMISSRKLDEGQEMSVPDLFEGFKQKGGKLAAAGAIYLVGSIVIGLIVLLIGVGAYFALGQPFFEEAFAYPEVVSQFVLLAVLIYIGLLLPLLMALWFAPALIIFHDVEVIDSIKLSFFGCLRNIIPFCWNGIILMIFFILASLPLFLGWLIMSPVLIATIYTAYKDIFVHNEAIRAV